MLRFVPGMIGALAGFVVVKLFSWTELRFEILAFFAAYAVVAVGVDRALRRYGEKPS